LPGRKQYQSYSTINHFLFAIALALLASEIIAAAVAIMARAGTINSSANYGDTTTTMTMPMPMPTSMMATTQQSNKIESVINGNGSGRGGHKAGSRQNGKQWWQQCP
jgi:hypothetical protein